MVRLNNNSIRDRKLVASTRGAVLVEFAIVSLLFYLLAAGTIALTQATYTLQVLQDAARVAARELSVLPISANSVSFEVLMGHSPPGPAQLPTHQLVRARVFDSHCLVVDIDRFAFDEVCPLVNRALKGVMIVDSSQGLTLLRYPGALRRDVANPLSGYAVALPVVRARDPDGVETIGWIPVIEEVHSAATPDPFLISQGGIVALRINYPFQSALLSAFLPGVDEGAPNIGNVVTADDSNVYVIDQDDYSPPGEIISDNEFGPYRGDYGLGKQFAFNRDVRPLRRMLSLQAFFRREVFTL